MLGMAKTRRTLIRAWRGQGRGRDWEDPGSGGWRGPSLGPGQGPRLQHSVLVHDFLHQLLLLTAQRIELVPASMEKEEAGLRPGRSEARGTLGHTPASRCSGVDELLLS